MRKYLTWLLAHQGALPEVGCNCEGSAPRGAVPLPRIRVVVEQEFDHCESALGSGGVEGCLALKITNALSLKNLLAFNGTRSQSQKNKPTL